MSVFFFVHLTLKTGSLWSKLTHLFNEKQGVFLWCKLPVPKFDHAPPSGSGVRISGAIFLLSLHPYIFMAYTRKIFTVAFKFLLCRIIDIAHADPILFIFYTRLFV
jgi:hypothetical protein